MRSDRGAMSIVVVAGSLVFCLFALCAADLGSMLTSRARAQAAADAAALAAIRQQVPALAIGDESPDDAARDQAERNGARLVRCDCVTGSTAAVVEVEVDVRATIVRTWAGRRAHATARAEADPDVLSYRAGA